VVKIEFIVITHVYKANINAYKPLCLFYQYFYCIKFDAAMTLSLAVNVYIIILVYLYYL